MFFLLHPGLLLIIFALLINLKNSWKNKIAISVPILTIILTSFIFFNQNFVSIKLDITQYIMSLALLTVLIANNIFTISHCKIKQSSEIQLSLIYIGAGIYIITTQHLFEIFLALELMMIAGGCIIFSGHNKASQNAGLSYIQMHLLSGTLFLLGIILAIISQQSLLITTFTINQLSISHILILSGLLINIAMPPFSYWLTEGYTAASPFGSVILSICMTKVTAMLLAKIFLGNTLLIYFGVFMGFYGIIYMLLETHLRKFITFAIISENGLILIAIGVGNFQLAMSLIILNIFYTAILMMCASRINVFTNSTHYFDIKQMPQKKLTLTVYIITLMSISAFPLTPGYINKYYLNLTITLLKKDWLLNAVTIINGGIIFTLFFKTIDFIALIPYTKTKNKSVNKIYTKLELYILTIASVIVGFLVCFILNLALIIDIQIFKQLLVFLLTFILFLGTRKYIYSSRAKTLIEPDYIYRKLLFSIYQHVTQTLSLLIQHLRKNQNKIHAILNMITIKLMGTQGILSYSRHPSSIIILVIIILIFFLIYI